jgi:phosphohistidine phosphatase
MKTLLLMRHAKSSWKDESLADLERPLNNRGSRDTPFMGKLLRERRIQPDALISSPAVRAMTTARVIAGELRFDPAGIRADKVLYQGDTPAMIEMISRTDAACGTILLVGHNPGITLLANRLSDSSIEHFSTCAVACFRFEIDSWNMLANSPGKLEFFERPKKYFR